MEKGKIISLIVGMIFGTIGFAILGDINIIKKIIGGIFISISTIVYYEIFN